MVPQKTTALVLIMLLMGLGFLAGSFAGGFIGQLTVPATHKSLVDSMKIIDTAINFELTPKLVDFGIRTSGEGWPLATIYEVGEFTFGEKYLQSTWIWQRYGDTEVVMTIWGPDASGKILSIEIARLGSSTFTVKIKGVTKLTMDQVTSTPAIGYYLIEVTVT